MIKAIESKEVYSTFMLGEVINKHKPSSTRAELVANPMYDVIVNSLDKYEELYTNIGYELVTLENAFYVKKENDDEGYKDSSMEVQVIIEAICIGLLKNHIPYHRLTNYAGGLPDGFINQCMEDVEISDLLKECGVADDLDKAIKNKLIARKIAYLNDYNRIVLSEAGISVFNALYESAA